MVILNGVPRLVKKPTTTPHHSSHEHVEDPSPTNAQNQTLGIVIAKGHKEEDFILKADVNRTEAKNVSLKGKAPQNDTQRDKHLPLVDVAVLKPIDNHQPMEGNKTKTNRKQKLLSKLTDEVLDKLFPSEVDDGIRKQVRQFSLQALDSFQTTDSQSALASSFSERRTAASEASMTNTPIYLPLLIATCFLFMFS